MYMVKAYNQYGMMQCKAMIAVLPDESKKPKETTPTFTNGLSNVTATVGEPLSLSVQLKEQLTPNYRVEWFKVCLVRLLNDDIATGNWGQQLYYSVYIHAFTLSLNAFRVWKCFCWKQSYMVFQE